MYETIIIENLVRFMVLMVMCNIFFVILYFYFIILLIVTTVLRRWQSLRTQFFELHRNINLDLKQKKKIWYHYDSMLFLKDLCTPVSKSNTDLSNASMPVAEENPNKTLLSLLSDTTRRNTADSNDDSVEFISQIDGTNVKHKKQRLNSLKPLTKINSDCLTNSIKTDLENNNYQLLNNASTSKQNKVDSYLTNAIHESNHNEVKQDEYQAKQDTKDAVIEKILQYLLLKEKNRSAMLQDDNESILYFKYVNRFYDKCPLEAKNKLKKVIDDTIRILRQSYHIE